MSRIPLASVQDFDNKTQELLQGLPPVNIALMLARTGIAPEIYSVVSALFSDDYLPDDDREIILYRICKDNDSQYEINFHRKTAALPQEIVDIVLSDDLGPLETWHQVLCKACDEITNNAKMSEDSVKAFVDHYGTYDMACRAIFLLSWFNMLTRYSDSTGVPFENDEVLKSIVSPVKMGRH
ncbi:hypothetical protein Misp06_01231 [Microbulbifer sp. NBRC 101763]|uniref:hypothetical protein n=1 Tax=Microbulbifer TaxID=48073 RepID=UPI0003799566|nr:MULTISPECIES: hypothetical protein [Microbulbifer]WHI51581.1 hypothetical protein P3339_01750 [Microbulbifer sp. MLAF003]